MVNLFINFYIDKDKARQYELMCCYFKNELNPAIDKLHIFTDQKTDKAGWIQTNGRPTFAEYFELVNVVTGPDDINIIANTDIYFDEENIELIKNNIRHNECYALARWDVQEDGSAVHFNRRDTNDVWIFKGPIKEIEDCKFTMGVPGCDNSICERIQRAGYTVKNPSIDVKTFHLHLTQVRNYDRHVTTPKPYLLVNPHTLNPENIYYHLITE